MWNSKTSEFQRILMKKSLKFSWSLLIQIRWVNFKLEIITHELIQLIFYVELWNLCYYWYWWSQWELLGHQLIIENYVLQKTWILLWETLLGLWFQSLFQKVVWIYIVEIMIPNQSFHFRLQHMLQWLCSRSRTLYECKWNLVPLYSRCAWTYQSLHTLHLWHHHGSLNWQQTSWSVFNKINLICNCCFVACRNSRNSFHLIKNVFIMFMIQNLRPRKKRG